MEHNWNELEAQARPVVLEAGRYILSQLGAVQSAQIEDKSVNSLVSYVDRSAEKMLVAGLSAILPEATFLTEEDTVENQESPLQWIIDPLDGTTNFLHGLPYFAVSVALRVEGTLRVGIVFDPCREECFSAVRGGGARMNGKPMQVSQCTNLADALMATGFPYYDHTHTAAYLRVLEYLMEHTRGVRRCGAAALDLANVALGRFDGFFEYSLQPWDVAAGILLVREAGGRLSDFELGAEYLFGRQIIAANPQVFPPFADLIRREFGTSGH